MKKVAFLFISILLVSCSPTLFKKKWLTEKAPETYMARFETSKGEFDIQVTRNSSPAGADRFFQLVNNAYFNDAVFYRVIPDFVAQFGSSNAAKNKAWSTVPVLDEPVLKSNTKGTISFARSGPKTRVADVYINLGHNTRLDTLNWNSVTGFPAFGEVINGLNVVEELYSGYASEAADEVSKLYQNRKGYLNQFPKLDTIRKAYIVK